MQNAAIRASYDGLGSAAVSDACRKLGLPVRASPVGLRPLDPAMRLAGRALPVQHSGSVDVVLEALADAEPGDVLVLDNQGRFDEACVGDLTALEARATGVSGLVVWGAHRDTLQLLAIGLPVFSLGSCSAGPNRNDPRAHEARQVARIGPVEVERRDFVLADADGAVFVRETDVEDVLSVARDVHANERRQAEQIGAGKSLRDQFRFAEYLARRRDDPTYTLGRHLQTVGGDIGE